MNADTRLSSIQRISVFVVVAGAGATLMALEVAGFRVIGTSFGSALRETTAVISVFLVAMSIGYTLGGRVGDRAPQLSTLGLVLLLAGALALAIPQLDLLLTQRIASLPAMPLHAFLATTALFALPTMLLAMSTPAAVRLLTLERASAGRVAGAVSTFSTIGSVIGSVATAFFLIDAIGSMQRTIVMLGSFTALLALILFAAGLRAPATSWILRQGGIIASSSLVVTGCIAYGGGAFHEPLEARGSKVVFERDSPYHHYRVIDHGGMRDLATDRTISTRMFFKQPLRGLEYVEYVHVARLLRPHARTTLLIGLGGGTLASQWTEWYPDTTVDAVEIDPLMRQVAKDYFGLRESERLHVYIDDGRMFLRRHGTYDLISVDAYTRGTYGATIPPHLVTREFFAEVARHLNDQGVVHYHCYGSRDNPFTQSLYKTLLEVFPSVLVLGNTEFLASKTQLIGDPDALVAAAAAIRPDIPFIDDRIRTLQRPLPATSSAMVLTDDYSPVDMLLHGKR